ncbi:hypothetical protein [Limnochorda pilosa]|uniref:DUF3606 domain-containing protein n=1 Tax=Limnochorda pilosa TaxID=1555112 RepID=A0A0K2SI02_LIMPI|nr:hypothetical protein [Limnochorda pilosa]BAS26710.1 hypothetical protein LIP_0853 [Limnochorda pilosa]
MSDRGPSNAPNTRNPGRPPRKPARLDTFADDLHDLELSGGHEEIAEDLGVTDRKEARSLRKAGRGKK